jgi:short chain dehydrogenase
MLASRVLRGRGQDVAVSAGARRLDLTRFGRAVVAVLGISSGVPSRMSTPSRRPTSRAYPPVVSDRWTAADLPDLGGRTAVVTGANSGIGLVTARELARVGAHVVLAVRDEERGRTAAASITGSTEVRRLDLADVAAVHAFAEEWDADVDVLTNNAG